MRYISDSEYRRRLKKIQRDNASAERHRKLEAERDKGRPKIKLPSTSKVVLFGIMAICLEIVIFCEWLMVVTHDTSSMYALIGIVSGLAVSIFGYYSKAKAENTVGGIKYEAAMHEIQNTMQTADDVTVAPDYDVKVVAMDCKSD